VKHLRRLLQLWGLSIAIGWLPATYLARSADAPLWYSAAAGLVDASIGGALGILVGGIVLLAGRDNADGGMKVARWAAAIPVALLWLAFLVTR
jgi:hypothetical protein